MKTVKCTIYQLGLPSIDSPVAIECMIKATKQTIKERLLSLQMEYWQEGDRKPKITTTQITPESILVRAESNDIDWSHAIRIKKTIWDSI